MATLDDYQRSAMRDAFRAVVADDEPRPRLLPWLAASSAAIPALFLAVAGRHRRLRTLRYPLAAAIVAVCAHQLLAGPPSARLDFASAYGAGFAAAWGALWALTVLVWIDPWASARVALRPAAQVPAKLEAQALIVDQDVTDALRRGLELYWQPFPADASFASRLAWSLDFCLSWRGVGWSWGTSPVPRFAPPACPLASEPVRLDSLPLTSSAGYRRHRTRASFFCTRLATLAVTYFILDAGNILAARDPYFVLGPPPDPRRPWAEQADRFPGLSPGAPPPPAALFDVPAHVAALARIPHLVTFYHAVMGFCAIIVGAFYMFSLLQVISLLLFSSARLLGPTSTAGHLWQHPSIFGSLCEVRDRGLAGLWSGWWHQTFRVAFVAPAHWLDTQGLLPRPARPDAPFRAKRLAYVVSAFGQSALLHAAGSATSWPPHSGWWMPLLFFVMQGVGLVIQDKLRMLTAQAADALRPHPRLALLRRLLLAPRACQAGRIFFAGAWLYATHSLFLDDLVSCGVPLFSSVPFSVVRGTQSAAQALARAARGAIWGGPHDDLASWHAGWRNSGLAV